jgi:uncharacterized protein with NAD-binding domain and iron-sulfur cluster
MLLGFYERTFALLRPLFQEWQSQFGSHDHPFQAFEDAFEPMYEMTVMEEVAGEWLPWVLKFPKRAGKPGVVPLPDRGAAGFFKLLSSLSALLGAASNVASRANGFRAVPRRIVALIKFSSVVAKGMAIDMLDGDYDKLDQLEIREWLQLHGLSEQLSEWVPVRLIYDLGFAYLNGDSSTPKNGRAAAGVTLRIMLRCLLGYREAPLYRMKAGMADTVFTQLYRVLRARGVQFKFFHRVTRLSLSASGDRVERIEIEKQAQLASGRAEYEPVYRLPNSDPIERWRSEPDWDQLAPRTRRDHPFESPCTSPHAEALELRHGEQFEKVVLGISLGGLRGLSPDLEQRRDFGTMLSSISTVRTQAAQLWFEASPVGPTGGRIFATGPGPFNTASDMSDLLPREGWPPGAGPKSLQYIVSSLPKQDPPLVPDEQRARENAYRWLDTQASKIWKDLAKTRLYHPNADASEAERRAFQFVKVHHNPSDDYVQSFPGSIDKRVGSRLEGIENLALAGDWVRTGLSVGCVESAVQGGIQAANVVMELPATRVD